MKAQFKPHAKVVTPAEFEADAREVRRGVSPARNYEAGMSVAAGNNRAAIDRRLRSTE
jgi:hypothetical protein